MSSVARTRYHTNTTRIVCLKTRRRRTRTSPRRVFKNQSNHAQSPKALTYRDRPPSWLVSHDDTHADAIDDPGIRTRVECKTYFLFFLHGFCLPPVARRLCKLSREIPARRKGNLGSASSFIMVAFRDRCFYSRTRAVLYEHARDKQYSLRRVVVASSSRIAHRVVVVVATYPWFSRVY